MAPEIRISIRQKIVDAMRDRFSAIRTENGYATNVGRNCFIWRDLEASPFTDEEMQGGGAINIIDSDISHEAGVLTVHDHEMSVTIFAAASASGGFSPADNHARRIEADIISAVGQDHKWTVGGVALAKDTIPAGSTMAVGHLGERIASVRYQLRILFRTQRFNPYTQ